MNAKTLTFLIGLIGIVGGSAMVANAALPDNSTALVGIAILAAAASLFIALLIEVMTQNIVNAIISKDSENQVSLLSSVIGRAVFDVIKEKEEMNK